MIRNWDRHDMKYGVWICLLWEVKSYFPLKEIINGDDPTNRIIKVSSDTEAYIAREFLFCNIYSENGKADKILSPSPSPHSSQGAISENREDF